MMERRRIVELWRKGNASVLVTLVRAEGSSYRQPGARLLIAASGEYAGTISGGCLEAEVVRKAAWMVRNGAVVERYSTMFDDTAEIPFGLGCGGTVDLLLEPADSPECAALMAAFEASLDGEQSTVITWLPQEGRRFARATLSVSRDFSFASDALAEAELVDARAMVLRTGATATQDEARYVERIQPPQRLFVLGAGDDARPLVSMAALLGWSVIVADGRAQLARRERFPDAERILPLTPDNASLDVTADDAVVLMTHSYEQDRALLAAVLPLRPRYLGVLGARHRTSLLISEVAELTGLTVADCLDHIYAPVGLDLGGDGPEAIALAVVAEAQACCMGKLGASRRLNERDVAEQIAQGGASRYLLMQCALDVSP